MTRLIQIEDVDNLLTVVNKFFENNDTFIEKIQHIMSNFDIIDKNNTVDITQAVKFFLYTWRHNNNTINSYSTIKHYIDDIFRYDRIERDILLMQRYFNLNDKKILDTGCCWGSVLTCLKSFSHNLWCIDHVPEHVTFTKYRIPDVQAFVGDVRWMDVFDSNSFDIVISRGVIEHVGDYSTQRGGVTDDNYFEKLRYMKEIYRILKPGGHLWLSTGNYAFPYDEESMLWFTHYLNGDNYEEYLHRTNTGADKYWICTWSQMESLLSESHFSITDVTCPDIEYWRKIINIFVQHIERCNQTVADLFIQQMNHDPRIMSSWMITALK